MKYRPMRLLVAALAAAFFAASTLAAQDFSGSVETRLGWYWSSANLLPQTQELRAGVDGKVGNADSPSAQYKAEFKASYDPATGTSSLSLGEAWIKVFEGPFDLSFGNQVVAWSVSDAFWPSDVVNPLDLSLPVDPVKTPVPLARVVYNGDILTLDFVAEPYWIAAAQPGQPWVAAVPSTVTSITTNTPALAWDNAGYGAHARASFDLLGGLDLGATFYRGRLSTPRASYTLTGYQPTAIVLDYDRATHMGANMVFAPGGDLLLKTEWVYTTLNDTKLIDPAGGEASVEGVSGFEYTLGSAQLEGEYVLDWSKAVSGAKDSYKHSAVAILSSSVGSRLNLKVAGVYEFTGDGGGMVAPRFDYTLADGLALKGESYFFFGDPATTYGAWKDNELGRMSLVYSF